MNRNQRRRNGNIRQAKQRVNPSNLSLAEFFGPEYIWPKGKSNRELIQHKAAHVQGELYGLSLFALFWDDCAVCLFKRDLANHMSEEEARQKQFQRADAIYAASIIDINTRKEIENE